MKVLLYILAGLAIAGSLGLAIIAIVFLSRSDRDKNFKKTEPARQARWPREPKPETEKEVSFSPGISGVNGKSIEQTLTDIENEKG